jgi:hypothetical protein
MTRFRDPGLFPGDPIADYYEAVAPPGYRAVYEGLAALGLDPLVANKLLPSVLALVAVAYFFRLALAIFPVPYAAFLAAAMLAVRIWSQDDVLSATSRAFFLPLFLAFLYYLVIGARGRAVATIAGMGLVYPQAAVLALGVLGVRLAAAARPWPPRDEVFFAFAAGVAAVVTALPFAYATARYGPIVTLEAARQMPEWERLFAWRKSLGGLWQLYVAADETGLLPLKRYFSAVPFLALALPLLARRRERFPALAWLGPGVAILPQVAIASVALFVAAHLALFRLYLPSRYTQHTLWLVMFLGSAIAIAVGLDAWRRAAGSRARGPAIGAGLAAAAILLPVAVGPPPGASYVVGRHPGLYAYLSRQPEATLVASLSDEADSLPAFTRRPVLGSFETYNGFHLGFAEPARTRARALAEAHYAAERAPIRAFVARYGVDFLLLDRDAFTLDYVRANRTIQGIVGRAGAKAIADALRRGTPLLARERPGLVWADDDLVLLDARAF